MFTIFGFYKFDWETYDVLKIPKIVNCNWNVIVLICSWVIGLGWFVWKDEGLCEKRWKKCEGVNMHKEAQKKHTRGYS